MIKAIIFDCFGVLVRDGWLPFRERHFRDDQEKMNQVTEANRRVNVGLNTYEEFMDELAELAEVSPQQVRREIEDNPPNAELFTLIRDQLRSQYKIGMLSNAASNWLDELFRPEDVALFDEIVLSYQIGVVKPHPRAYEAIAERLGLALEECLLVDDQSHYCEGARAVGMQAIHYQDNLQLLATFNDLGIKTQ